MVRSVRLLLAFVSLVAVLPVRAQTNPAAPGPWVVHTSMRRVVDLAAAGDTVLWAATAGGVFRYRIASGDVRRYTTADGLSGRDARAVAVDARRGVVWIGYAGGVVDRLDVASGRITTLRDVERATRFPQRDVNRLVLTATGDTLYAATRFGVVAFDAVWLVVRESYTQFAGLAAGQAARDVLRASVDGRPVLAVAADGGVALGPLDGRNLQDPASWTVETAGLPSTSVQALTVRGATLVAATDAGLAERTGAAMWARLGGTQGPVRDVLADGAALVAADESGLVVYDGGQSARATEGVTAPRALVRAGGRLWVGDGERGLVGVRRSGLALTRDAQVVPPGPYDNTFATLSFAPDGTLWAAGNGSVGAGLYRLAPEGTWTSFTSATVAGFPIRLAVVAADRDAGAWGGTFGVGAVHVTPAGAFTRYTTTNASLRPSVPNNPDFVIVDGASVDDAGNVWMTNKQAAAPYHVRTPDGRFTALALPPQNGYDPSFVGLSRVYVDGAGLKWIIVQNELDLTRTRGLLVHESGRTPADVSDDAVRLFGMASPGVGRGFPSSAAGPSQTLNAVVEDRRGRLWAGTDKGLAYLPNTPVIARDTRTEFAWPAGVPGTDGTRPFVLLGLNVNALAVDAANGLWVGTNEGAYRVAEAAEGFVVTDHFTVANAPLPGNRVLAIAVSPETGHVFLATEQGLVAYTDAARPAAATPQPLFVYPNPVRAVEGPVRVMIEGLVANADVRILAPDGRLVRRLAATGGSIEWDARGDDGADVPSGVYLVVAASTKGAAYGKVAVIR
jgi:ligand-binding sensor domain-containing protein